MLQNWSIRATLTGVGIVQIALTFVVGALGLVALGEAGNSLGDVAHVDVVAIHALDDASSYLMRTTMALRRASNLAVAGDADGTSKAIDRAGELLAHADEVWKTFEALPKTGLDPAQLDALAQKRTTLIQDGIQGEIAALRANDQAAYHALDDTKMAVMLSSYDMATLPIVKLLEDRAKAREQAANERIVLMRSLIVAAAVVALIVVLVIRVSLRGLIVEPLKKAVECFEHIARGDLTYPVPAAGKSEIGHMFDGIKRMQDSLVGLVSAVHANASSIDVGAREIAMGNTDLSQRTEQQAASLQETASSMEQLTGTVRQNAENARQASQLAVNASDIATRGGAVVGEVVETMQDIAASSAKVVDIISVIEGIAFQTNILALNAAVEAARAGEQGRGFAVVAGEVRSLAQRSASAAKEIKELISDSAHKVESGSELVGRAGTTMEEIVLAVRRVTDIMGEISAASEEQSTGIEQVNRAVSQMDTVTQQNAALVEEATAAAASLEEQTRQLQSVLSTWRTGARSAAASASASGSVAAPARKAPAMPSSASSASISSSTKSASSASSASSAASASTAPTATSKPAAAEPPSSPKAAPKSVAKAAPSAVPKAAPKPAPKAPARSESALSAVAPAASASDDSDWETF